MSAIRPGVLVVDKPKGPTSADVVARVRSWGQGVKAGHTGTLDPMATGVLPVCLGDATRIAGFVSDADKAYEATIRLGIETETLDADGAVVREAAVPALNAEALERALAGFRGPQKQTPPMFSAKRVGGKRLYELARAGEEVEREPVEVVVHELVLRGFDGGSLTVSVACSKGYFVRVLAFDLGRALGCGAHLSALRRTRSGPFTLAQAVTLEQLSESAILPIEEALRDLPAVEVSKGDAEKVTHGIRLAVGGDDRRVRVLGPGASLLAIADVRAGRLEYCRVLGARA